MNRIIFILLTTVLLVGSADRATAQHADHSTPGVKKSRPAECLVENAKPFVLCAEVPTPSFDAKGNLWLTWTQGGHIYVTRADHDGQPLGEPVQVTDKAYPIDKNGENRPKSIIAPNGEVYVTFTAKGTKKYTGVVYFSRSDDGGGTFSIPVPITDEAESSSQRFDIMKVSPDGRLFIAWIDKRDAFAAKNAKAKYRGAAIYYVLSSDGGRTFSANFKAADNSCECCRVAMDIDPQGNAVIVWRHVFEPNFRDHAVATLNGEGSHSTPVRLSVDQWALDGCPHHGPSISITETGVRHVVWYTAGKMRKGLFYTRSDDGGKTFTEPMGFGRRLQHAAHPYVLADGKRVFTAWKEFNGQESEFYISQSADGGRSWSMPLRVAGSAGGTDHPVLIQDGKWLYASWGSDLEGWRLFRVAPLGAGGA